MTILDLYGQRMKLCHWLSSIEFEAENHYQKNPTMSLHIFTKVYYAGNICCDTQILKKHWKNKCLVLFCLHLSSIEDGTNHRELCKYELIKQKLYISDMRMENVLEITM